MLNNIIRTGYMLAVILITLVEVPLRHFAIAIFPALSLSLLWVDCGTQDMFVEKRGWIVAQWPRSF